MLPPVPPTGWKNKVTRLLAGRPDEAQLMATGSPTLMVSLPLGVRISIAGVVAPAQPKRSFIFPRLKASNLISSKPKLLIGTAIPLLACQLYNLIASDELKLRLKARLSCP